MRKMHDDVTRRRTFELWPAGERVSEAAREETTQHSVRKGSPTQRQVKYPDPAGKRRGSGASSSAPLREIMCSRLMVPDPGKWPHITRIQPLLSQSADLPPAASRPAPLWSTWSQSAGGGWGRTHGRSGERDPHDSMSSSADTHSWEMPPGGSRNPACSRTDTTPTTRKREGQRRKVRHGVGGPRDVRAALGSPWRQTPQCQPCATFAQVGILRRGAQFLKIIVIYVN